MSRKVSMVVIDVVLAPSGVAVQSNVALLLLVCMLISTIVWKPFEKRHLGILEILSLSTSSCTLWLGTFFWSMDNKKDATFLSTVSVTIIFINVMFMLYLLKVFFHDTCRDYDVVNKFRKLGKVARNRLRRGWSDDISASGGSKPGTAEVTSRKLELTSVRTKRVNNKCGDKSKATITTSQQIGDNALEGKISSINQALNIFNGEVPQHTKETQREVPTSPARPAVLSRKVTYVPEGWMKFFTDEGKPYYVNPNNESQWEKPPGND